MRNSIGTNSHFCNKNNSLQYRRVICRVRVVFNATFKNISIIYPEKTIELSQVTDKLYRITSRHEHDTNTNLVVINTDYTGSCKSNYHTTTTAPGDNCIVVYYLILK